MNTTIRLLFIPMCIFYNPTIKPITANNEAHCRPTNILLSKQVQMVDKHELSGLKRVRCLSMINYMLFSKRVRVHTIDWKSSAFCANQRPLSAINH